MKKQSSATKEEDLLQQGQNITNKTGGYLWTPEEEQEEASPLILLSKASKMEERSKGGKRRKGRVVSSRWSKDSSYPPEDLYKSSWVFLLLKKGIHCFSVLTDLPSPLELMGEISHHFHKSSTFLDKSLQSTLMLNSAVINVEAHPFQV